jgi:hypothetical protein
MANIIIGSSNVTRYKDAFSNQKLIKKYDVRKCTELDSFDAHVVNILNPKTNIIISVVENFIEKAVLEKEDVDLETILECLFQAMMITVKNAALRMPNSKFAMIRPLSRPALTWYTEHFDKIKEIFDREVDAIEMDNVMKIDAISLASQQFDKDQVHLTKTSAMIFIEGIITCSESFFNAEVINLEAGGSEERSGQPEIERRLTLLEEEVRARKSNDNLLFARVREELDSMANKTKEDRLVLTGLTSRVAPPAGPGPRRDWLREIVTETIKSIKEDFNGKILFINQGKNNGRDIPMVEIKLESAEIASEIRKMYAEKRKAGKDFGRLFVANCVGLATRVRVDIMKAIAAKLTSTSQIAYVTAFTSRPILHIKPQPTRSAGSSRPEFVNATSFTFSDAVSKFGNKVGESDLADAYRRTGTAFAGQLEQHFVVLRDGVREGPKTFDNPRKRKFEEDSHSGRGGGSKGARGYSKHKRP